MNTDNNRAMAIAIVESIGAGRLPLAAFHDDATWWMQGQDERPVAAVAAMIAAFHASRLTGENRMTVHGVTAEGGRVAVEAECCFQLAKGGSYTGTYHFLIGFRDGQACLVREYFDTAHAAQAFRDPA